MNFKRIIALFLVSQMLVMNFASCSDTTVDETEKVSEDTAAVETSGETEPAETEFDRRSVSDELPEITFGGRDFRFLVNEGEMFQLVSDDDSGVGLDSVIYDRNKRVEDRFDVKITADYQLGTESQDIINNYASTGEHIAEVCDHWHRMGLSPVCYFHWLSWLDIPHFNWEQPWWNKEANESAYIKGKLFTVTGDLSVTSMQDTWAIAFNMDLIKDYGYTADELYNTVFDGEWTLDKLIEIGSSMYKDVNGNGEEDLGDIYGYMCDTTNRTMPWVTSIGEKFFTITEDRTNIEITLGTEKVYSALEKLCNFHHNVIGTYSLGNQEEDAVVTNKQIATKEFVEGRVGLYPTTFESCYTDFTNLEFTYGMLPFPKYDTAQERYLTVPEYDFSVYGVPVTLPMEDYEMVGVVMEALMAESWKTVTPAYYDEALKGRYSADETTARMIDLIMDGRVFDWGYQVAIYLTCKFPYLFCYQINDNNIDLASTMAAGMEDNVWRIQDVLSFYDD
ncbi:MAG: hypothetical protein E7638_01485 [Ruminococcaceae bacterium]|nr:hypothetical protein [Oscillospiraceae bacterium]